MSEDNFTLDEQLNSLTLNSNWKKIIELGTKLPIEEKNRYIWAWPSENNLVLLNEILKELHLKKILSIGCGSGLLEWMIMTSTGIQITGVERDEFWWTSKFSPQKFIKMNFISETTETSKYFFNECYDSSEFALFFCYFNNKNAFVTYLNEYEKLGNCLIIIGPGKEKNKFIVTVPAPFDLGIETHNWFLWKYFAFGDANDYIAIYKKT